jgi:hypothetical protein
MWRPTESTREEISNVPGRDPQSKRRRSRRRAWRDGLADQTVLQPLEDVRSYREFERALIGSVDPRSALELALVHRLASLLWRLRRASAIETALFEIQGELLLAGQRDASHRLSQPGTLRAFPQGNGHNEGPGSNGRNHPSAGDQEPLSTPLAPRSKSRAIAQCFLRLSNLDPSLLDRVGSHEARLWRQAAQTIWTLEEMRRPPPAPTRRRFRKPAGISDWDAER